MPTAACRPWPTLTCLGLAVVLFAAFVRNERRAPLIEPALRRVRSLRAGAAATALYMASVGSEFYLLTLLLQDAEGLRRARGRASRSCRWPCWSPPATGRPGRALRRYRPATVLAAGFAAATAGLLWLALALPGDSYAADLLPGLLLSGFGHGVIYTSMFVIGTRDVPAAHQGTAGALLTTSQYLSAAVTVAVLTLVLGPAPDAAAYRAAFLVTAAAAAAGLTLATRNYARETAQLRMNTATTGPVCPTA